MEEELARYNEFLLQLYRDAEECAPGDFQRQSLQHLTGLLPSDCAAWGGGYAAQRSITDLVVWNENSRILTDWHHVREVDPLCDMNLRRLGEVHHIGEIPGYRDSLAFNEHWRRYDIHQLMATIINEPQTNYVSFIALCHTDPAYPYTEWGRTLTQAILPHLIQAQRQNQRIYLQKLANPSQAVALVSAGGLVQASHSAFDALLRDHWNQHSRLPGPVMDSLREHKVWRAGGLEARAQCLGSGYLVRLEIGSSLDSLSPREREVAELYASGLNYKEIAQRFGRSPATVRNLLARCYQKLDVHDKVALIRRLDPKD